MIRLAFTPSTIRHSVAAQIRKMKAYGNQHAKRSSFNSPGNIWGTLFSPFVLLFQFFTNVFLKLRAALKVLWKIVWGFVKIGFVLGVIGGIIYWGSLVVKSRNRGRTEPEQSFVAAPESPSYEFNLEDWQDAAERGAGERQTLWIGGKEYGFVWIPAGEFEMGAPGSDRERFDNETLHRARLTKGFWMLETETTQALYQEIMGTNPSDFNGENFPVETVSWRDADKFCEELTKRLPEGLKASLPTEAQWEYACRAGTKTAYWHGTSADSSKMNYNDNVGKTTSVKSYEANPWGLYDMHGNVWEWTSDYYGDYPLRSVVDPDGTGSYGSNCVTRGGAWDTDARGCRSAFRGHSDPYYKYGNLGFRFILTSDRP